MELYTLNSFFQRVDVIDIFESMIWTERFSSWGDFELQLISTPEMRRLLTVGTRLAMSHSYRVMTVEMVEDSRDAEGRSILKVSGRSLECILEDRTARNTFATLDAVPNWELTGTPGDIVRKIFNDICRTNLNFPDDEIPYLYPGSLFPASTIPEPDEVITIEIGLDTVYSAITELCEVYDLGFRLVRNFDKSQLLFDVYSGDNRTTFQTNFDPVVFAPNLDNLQDVNSVTSIGDYKNVAYVFHPYSTQIVTADGVSVEVEGFDRRVLTVDASDIDMEAGPELNAAMMLRGKDELARHRRLMAFDGQLPSDSPYPYELSYRLGDLVEMRDNDGVTNQMRVTEQIFVSDGEGERSYPTLTTSLTVYPDTWSGWDHSMEWVDAPGHWGEELPPSNTSPGAPAVPTVVSTTTTSEVTWLAPESTGGAPITQYEVQYSTDEDFLDSKMVIAYGLSKSITELIPATSYSYRVRARNVIGASPWSPAVTVMTQTGLSLALVGPAGTRLTIPTHISPAGGQTIHPSVVDFGEDTPWNGYRYWMSHTPYPGGSDVHEDPNIVASNDGSEFVVPPGLKNPIDDQAGSPQSHNSDANLVYGPDDQLWLFWRTYVPNATGEEERIFLSKSSDGVTWSPKVLIWQTAMTSMRLISPSFVYENGAWTMWAVDIVGTLKVRRVRSKGWTLTAPSSWNNPQECTVPSTGTGRQPWHLTVKRINDIYIGMLNDRPTGLGPGGDLYIIRSLDGITWEKAPTVAIPRSGGTAPGHQNLYTATFTQISDDSLDVWYTGWNNTPAPIIWNVFRTTLTSDI